MYWSPALPLGMVLEGEGGFGIRCKGWGSVEQNALERGGGVSEH